MKKVLLGLAIFFAAFGIGFVFAPEIKNQIVASSVPVTPEQPLIETISAAKPEKSDDSDFDAEFVDLPEIAYPESSDKLVDVLERDGLYRESEVIAKSGETWLALFEQNGKYSLKNSKATVKRKRTISFPGDEYDVRLTFDKPGVPIIALRNFTAIKPGPVTTVYHRPSWKEIERRNLPIDAMKTGFKREFNLNDNWYTLRVSQGLSRDGTKIGILVLEYNGISQVIAQNYHEPGYGEIIGDLLWVGDVDNDGKLDLYFDRFNEVGAFSVGLHLSSEAENGKLVKLVATFGTAGC